MIVRACVCVGECVCVCVCVCARARVRLGGSSGRKSRSDLGGSAVASPLWRWQKSPSATRGDSAVSNWSYCAPDLCLGNHRSYGGRDDGHRSSPSPALSPASPQPFVFSIARFALEAAACGRRSGQAAGGAAGGCAGAAMSSQSPVRGRSWVEAAVREAGQAQQAPMSRVLILLVGSDIYSLLAVWLYGARADLYRVGSELSAVKNCCRLVTVAFISATLSRRVLEVIEDAPQRGHRGWRGSPKLRLEESFVVWSRTIYFHKARDDEVATLRLATG